MDKKVYMDIGGKKIEVNLIPAANYPKKGPTVDNKDFIKSAAEKAEEPISPTERMNKKKAEAREQRMTLKDIGMAKGGRAGYRMGGKCKLAKRGKGRAYGKNS